MKNPEGFVKYLREEFDIDNIPQPNVDAISKYVKDEENFNPAVGHVQDVQFGDSNVVLNVA